MLKRYVPVHTPVRPEVLACAAMLVPRVSATAEATRVFFMFKLLRVRNSF
jgi:hypothetical protein